jgi:hypothetical protein
MHRNDQDAGSFLITYLAKDLQSVEARDSQIQQKHIGFDRFDNLNGLKTVSSFRNDFDSGLYLEQQLQSLSYEIVVLCNGDSYSKRLHGY